MPLDGITAKRLAAELDEALSGARLDRVAQPGRYDVVLQFRKESSTLRLLLSANPSAPRIHLLDGAPENPPEPPAFCMFLRKHLSGGRVVDVSTPDYERVFVLRIQTLDEIGDRVEKRLVAELMGKQSNLVLLGPTGRILDALLHVDASVSRVREVMPGRMYPPVPPQGKPPPEAVLAAMDRREDPFAAASASQSAEKAVLAAVQGFSPPLCRDVCRHAGLDPAATFSGLGESERSALAAALHATLERIVARRFEPTVFYRAEGDDVPYDFHALPLRDSGIARTAASVGAAMALLYGGRALRQAFDQSRGDLLRIVETRLDKAVKRLAAHESDVAACAGRERWRRYGDLILASLAAVPSGGAPSVLLPDVFEEGAPAVEVPLDPTLSPTRNAQRLFRRYAKERAKEEAGLRFAEEDRKEIEYLSALAQAVRSADDRIDLEALREEVARLDARMSGDGAAPKGGDAAGRSDGGPGRPGRASRFRPPARKKAPKEPKALPPRRYVSADGFEIRVGRSNLQNDELTLRKSAADDLWFHVRQAPGTHVVVRAAGREIPDATKLEAATLAAWFSRAAAAERRADGTEGAKTAVDWCPVRNVKKPPGAKPGMVTYENYRTMLVTPRPPSKEAGPDPT